MNRNEIKNIADRIAQNPLETDEQKRAALQLMNTLYDESWKMKEYTKAMRGSIYKAMDAGRKSIVTRLGCEMRYLDDRKSYVLEKVDYSWFDYTSGWC